MATTNDFQNTDLLQIFEAITGTTTTDLYTKVLGIYYNISANTFVVNLGDTASYSDAIDSLIRWQNSNPTFIIRQAIIGQKKLNDNTSGYVVGIIYVKQF